MSANKPAPLISFNGRAVPLAAAAGSSPLAGPAFATAQGSNRVAAPGLPITPNRLAAFGLPFTLAAANSAAGFSVTIPYSGNSFYLSSCNGTVLIQPTGGDLNSYVQGTGENFGADGSFPSITITNPSNSPVSGTLQIGYAQFIDKRLIFSGATGAVFVQNAPTTNVGSALASLAPGSFATFPGNANGTTARKQIMVANINGGTSGTQVLTIEDRNNLTVGTVFSGTSWTFESSDEVIVKNANAGGTGNILCSAGEVYYAS